MYTKHRNMHTQYTVSIKQNLGPNNNIKVSKTSTFYEKYGEYCSCVQYTFQYDFQYTEFYISV